jgi:hypothetical protein
MRLTSVYNVADHELYLYDLLRERTPEQSISHERMPSYAEHCEFVRSRPYVVWCFIEDDAGERRGTVYLTRNNEIGVFVFARYHGMGTGIWAVREINRLFPDDKFANVNPGNRTSRCFFEKLGGKLIQVTYKMEVPRGTATEGAAETGGTGT